ncbi:amidohydrolase family protein, partial [Steroidobacter sp.]|uniref:amidohydrolase family protein n=1 Tax=Steroidobacter sp. TaxID=1978227 RepID=UPI001A413585
RLPNGTPRRLTQSHSGFQPSWSADGRFLVYVSWEAGEGGHVWRIPAHGGVAQRLTQAPGYYTDPVFDTDGKSVYALRSSAYERTQVQKGEMNGSRLADIVRLAADGTSFTVLSQEPQIRALRFSPGLQRLSFEGEDQTLQSIRTDGSDRRSHVTLRGMPGWVAAPQLSPDGRWALAPKGGQLYLLPLTEPTDRIDLGSSEFAGLRISELGADYFAWADGGKTITWALGRDFHRTNLDAIDRTAGTSDTVVSRGVERFSAKLEVPRDIPKGTLVLRGATAITMRADEVIENADVVIIDNRIAAVGRAGQVPVPKSAVVRDVSGRFIVPGFIDTHAHWVTSRFDVLDLQAWSFMINLAHGVTAGLDVQPFTQDVFAYADMIDAGFMVGLRTFSTGRGIGFNGERVGTAQDAQLIQRRYRDAYETRNLKAYGIGNRHNRQLFINAAESLGMMPTIEGIELHAAITHAIDGFHANEHEMGSVRLYRDVIELFARTGTGYNPTLLVADGGPRARNHFYVTQAPHENPKINRFMPHFLNDLSTRQRNWSRDDEQIFPGVARGARDIVQAGGRVGVGSHGEFQGLDYHWEMQALASGGMTPMQVLRAATKMGSEIIGRAEDLGSLEPGKLADLLILTRDPRQDIRNAQQIEFVMKNGRLYVAETLDEVWPRQRPMPPAWFTRQMPAMRIGTP